MPGNYVWYKPLNHWKLKLLRLWLVIVQKLVSCLKSGIKPSPNPWGVEGQNLYNYFFFVREISQLASSSCAKHGFSQWLPAISNRSLKFSCVSSEFFSNCKVFFPLALEFLVFTRDARDPINLPIIFKVLELYIEVDVVTSSIFYSEGSSAGSSAGSRSFTVKPRQVSVPAYVQKVIFGSHVWFGMYEKIL